MYIMLGIPIQRKFSWKACKILRAGTIFIHSHSFFWALLMVFGILVLKLGMEMGQGSESAES